jgi:toxin-antitoxin system PIN domain toxin
MPISLLDVNVLLALAWPTHVHHDAAHRWFAANRLQGWSTCVHTEMGFVRLSMQPALVKTAIGFSEALRALTSSLSSSEHEFWTLDRPFAEIDEEIRSRIAGHRQLADGLLLDLAIGKAGRLATFDRRIESLLASGSPNRSAIELIPV